MHMITGEERLIDEDGEDGAAGHRGYVLYANNRYATKKLHPPSAFAAIWKYIVTCLICLMSVYLLSFLNLSVAPLLVW